MTLRKQGDTGYRKRGHLVTICGEIALGQATDLL